MKSLTPLVRNQIIKAQRNEITEFYTYKKLSQKARSESNREVLSNIADDEFRHYEIWKKYSGREVGPSQWNINKFYWIARIFGLTFGLKLMERGEERAQINYNQIGKEIPEAIQIAKEENDHEKELIALIDEDQLKYIGSIVLGLNDALVEILGTLAGLTFALQTNW